MNLFIGLVILLLLIVVPNYFVYKGLKDPKKTEGWFSRKIFYFWFFYGVLVVLLKVINGNSDSRPFLTSTLIIFSSPILLTLLTVKIKRFFSKPR
jgi:hypothetical protein